MTEDLNQSRISSLEAKLAAVDARLASMDKAVALLEKFPTAIDIAVGNLEKLHEEKFRNVGVRFDELNTRLTEGDRYKQTALDAALKAAETLVNMQQLNNKESIKKTEELFTKQIENVTKTADDLRQSDSQNSGGKRALDNSWYVMGFLATLAVAVGGLVIALLRH